MPLALSTRSRVLILGALVVVLLAVLAWLVLPGLIRGEETSSPPPSPTATAPEPIHRKTPTPLVKALPDEVADYAVTGQKKVPAHNPKALETWQLTYTSATDAVTVQVAQWEKPRQAREAMNAVVGNGSTQEDGDVLVQEKKAGRYAIVQTADGARAVWTNATVLFVVDAQTAEAARAVYQAFPL